VSPKPLFIILGNQLFPLNEINSYKDSYFFMAEDFELCTYEKHHKHKLILFLSSMRKYASELKSKKFNIKYFQLNKKNIKFTYEDKLSEFIKSKNISEITMFEVEDKFFEKRILNFSKKNNIKINFIDSPMFLNTRNDFKIYLSKVKKPFMATYYKQQRIEKNILMIGDKPIGEKWSFDEENRKKIPDNFSIPSLPNFAEDITVKNVKKIVDDFFPDHPGDVTSFWLGSSRKDALKALDLFIKDKIINFGDYEDAVKKNSPFFITQCS
jgi:deoxyribodipyrimidine photolyase-related protein